MQATTLRFQIRIRIQRNEEDCNKQQLESSYLDGIIVLDYNRRSLLTTTHAYEVEYYIICYYSLLVLFWCCSGGWAGLAWQCHPPTTTNISNHNTNHTVAVVRTSSTGTAVHRIASQRHRQEMPWTLYPMSVEQVKIVEQLDRSVCCWRNHENVERFSQFSSLLRTDCSSLVWARGGCMHEVKQP